MNVLLDNYQQRFFPILSIFMLLIALINSLGFATQLEQEHIHINFVIDENYLIGHILTNTSDRAFSCNEYKKDITDFRNYIWEKCETDYRLLPNEKWVYPQLYSHKNLRNLMEIAKESPLYKKLYMQTEEYRLYCENEWLENYEKAFTFVRDLTGLNMEKELTVYITHPGLRNGRYWGNNLISWGTTGDFQYYEIIYIWHEILHSYLPKSEISHCLIQYISDNELRKLFNPSENFPPFIGHHYLNELMEKIYPDWQEYLKRNNHNILELLYELSKN